MKALEKATSLHRFALEQGAQLSTFKLALTDAEAFEALDWFKTQMYQPDATFDMDLEIAHRTGDPWRMLQHFQLMGLDVVPASLVLN